MCSIIYFYILVFVFDCNSEDRGLARFNKIKAFRVEMWLYWKRHCASGRTVSCSLCHRAWNWLLPALRCAVGVGVPCSTGGGRETRGKRWLARLSHTCMRCRSRGMLSASAIQVESRTLRPPLPNWRMVLIQQGEDVRPWRWGDEELWWPDADRPREWFHHSLDE